ncbi:MAG: hypothetical protein WCG98_01610 [bacterium]
MNPREDSLHSIYCKYRAYAQWPKVYFTNNGKRVIIEEMQLEEGLYTHHKNTPLIHGNNTINEAVEHLMLKPEGKKPMSRKEFANGYLK